MSSWVVLVLMFLNVLVQRARTRRETRATGGPDESATLPARELAEAGARG